MIVYSNLQAQQDCDRLLHRPPGLHLLLCPRPLAVSQAAPPPTELSSPRRPECPHSIDGVSGNHPEQGPGGPQV